MCGIAGAMGANPEGLRECVARMTAAIAHRGPDGQALWQSEDGRVVFGHRRLAVIDLSEGGLQPKISQRTGSVLTFNGEIYNYLELRRELQAAGIVFHTESDSEVLLEACDHWGVREAAARFEGMFAFAHWQPRTGTLSLVRDRAGKKPLYVLHHEGALYFASEIKALRAIFADVLSTDFDAIDLYLSLGYIPHPLTAYREITEVGPGHVLSVARDGARSEQPYWEYPRGPAIGISFEDAVSEAEAKLRNSIRLRLRADVPVGVFLSGGIDSGLLTAIAAQECANPLRTFTVTFGDTEFDEGPLARLVSERYGTRHTEVRLDTDIDALLPKIVAAYDEPFGDASALPTYAVSEAAAKELKVVLSGEGSDEQFGGYRRHLASRYFTAAQRATFGIFAQVAPSLSQLLPDSTVRRSRLSFVKRFLRGAGNDPFERFILWSTDGFIDAEKSSLMGAPGQSAAGYLARTMPDISALDPVRQALALDFLSMLPDALLVKGDIATMAHSLEARSPFLDSQLVAWSARLPVDIKFHGSTNKPILRALARKFLPQQIVDAPKRGFEIPVAQWMSSRGLAMLRDLASSQGSILQTRFGKKPLQALLESPAGMSTERWSNLLWLLLMLALWDEQQRSSMPVRVAAQ